MKNSELTDREIKAELERTKANFAIEGMEIPETSIELARKTLANEISLEEGMKRLIKNYGEDA